MGQRLNIEIMVDDKIVANSYYHWDGYSAPTVKHAYNIARFLKREKQLEQESDTQYAVRILEHTGAGLLQEIEIDYAINHYNITPKVVEGNRNSGLISVTKEGIEETESWQELGLTINLSDCIIDFGWLVFEEEPDAPGYKGIRNINTDIDLIGWLDYEEIIEIAPKLIKAMKNLKLIKIKDSYYGYTA